jgi:hypothetical protein
MTKMVATLIEPDELAEPAWFIAATNLPSADLADPHRLFFQFTAD